MSACMGEAGGGGGEVGMCYGMGKVGGRLLVQ